MSTRPIGVLLVPSHDADRVIEPLRRRLDPTWRQRMPAHVTLLVPFLHSSSLDAAGITSLQRLIGSHPAFDYVLEETRWFGDDVLYLKPEPSEPFRQLALALMGQFPECRPYDGAFNEVVPHVTIGKGGRWRKRRWRMRAAARRMAAEDAIRAHASEVFLMDYEPASNVWKRSLTFPLGAPKPDGRPATLCQEPSVVPVDGARREPRVQQALGPEGETLDVPTSHAAQRKDLV